MENATRFDSKFVPEKLLQAFQTIEALLTARGRAVIAIDGHCGAGKTTAANHLATCFESNVIHMDDFFLPARMRTQARVFSPGGNIHYERFYDEVVRHLRENSPFSYRVYDCHADRFCRTVAVTPRPLTIVEGSYSMHPHFGDIYDLTIFMEIDAVEQRRRIVERNGAHAFVKFRDVWIPLENEYIEHFQIRQKSDCIIC